MNLGMHSFILRLGDEILACFPTLAEWLQLGMLSNHLEDEECIRKKPEAILAEFQLVCKLHGAENFIHDRKETEQ